MRFPLWSAGLPQPASSPLWTASRLGEGMRDCGRATWNPHLACGESVVYYAGRHTEQEVGMAREISRTGNGTVDSLSADVLNAVGMGWGDEPTPGPRSGQVAEIDEEDAFQ